VVVCRLLGSFRFYMILRRFRGLKPAGASPHSCRRKAQRFFSIAAGTDMSCGAISAAWGTGSLT